MIERRKAGWFIFSVIVMTVWGLLAFALIAGVTSAVQHLL